jgi:peptidyl-prolyl cis-trans isomerase D
MTTTTPTVNKKKNIIYQLIIALVAVGFGLQFYNSNNENMSNLTTIAAVNGTDITNKDIQKILQNYASMGFPESELKKFEETALKQEIKSKIFENWSKQLGLGFASDEIIDQIKSQKYFLNESGKFSIDQYKQVLLANRLTPSQYEKEISTQQLIRKSQVLSYWYPSTTQESKDLYILDHTGINVSYARVTAQDLKPLLKITPEEIAQFTSKAEAKATLESLYEKNSYRYNIPASVDLNVIAININKADKTSAKQDLEKLATSPSFAKDLQQLKAKYKDQLKVEKMEKVLPGRFNQSVDSFMSSAKNQETLGPIEEEGELVVFQMLGKNAAINKQLSDVKNELAEEYLKTTKPEALTTLAEQKANDVKVLLEKKNWSALDAAQKKFSFTYKKEFLMKNSATNLDGILLQPAELTAIKEGKSSTQLLKKGNEFIVITLLGKIEKSDPQIIAKWSEESKKEESLVSQLAAMSLSKTLMTYLLNNMTLKIYAKEYAYLEKSDAWK